MLGRDRDGAVDRRLAAVPEGQRAGAAHRRALAEERLGRRRRSARAWCAVTVAVLGLSLFAPLGSAGLWEPLEVDVAELSRRIAVNLLGAGELRLPDAVNEVPIRRELGRGEVPFTSVALGFKLFGLSDWAGRLPLAVWGALGGLATYALVLRLGGWRRACVSTLVLSVTPLYFVQARALFGDIATLATFAIALAGLGVSLLDTRLTIARKVPWLLAGVLGLALGFWCRGLLLGVGVPLGAVCLARLGGDRNTEASFWRRRGLDAALVLTTALVTLFGLWALRGYGAGTGYSILVGASRTPVEKLASHEGVVHALGHALFPVSALLPFAFAYLFRVSRSLPAAQAGEDGLRRLVAAALTLGLGAHATLGPSVGMLPFSATTACAIAVGLMLTDLSVARVASRVVAMCGVALSMLLFFDFRTRPESAFAAFGVGVLTFPDALAPIHQSVWSLGTLLVLVPFFFAVQEAGSGASQAFACWHDYREYLRALRSAYGGSLWFALVASWVVLLIWGWALIIGENLLGLRVFAGLWSLARTAALHAWWVTPALVLFTPLAVLSLRDAVRWLSREKPTKSRFLPTLSRTGLVTTGLVACGLLLSLYYYPKLSSEFSPKQVFEAYTARAKPNEPLALLGVSSSVAAYYTKASPDWLATPAEAAEWLDDDAGRRFVLVRTSDLAELNAAFRKSKDPAANLPVIAAGSSEILLASNRSGGELNENPFEALVRTEVPSVRHPVLANLAGRLEIVGWQIRTDDGALTTSVLPGRSYQLELVYRVVGQFMDEWDTFVHIDGYGRRFNADHETLQGRYPMRFWNRGDVIVDKHALTLDPNFTPGDYRLYFGMYRGQRRLPVTRGSHDADRVDGGVVKVR